MNMTDYLLTTSVTAEALSPVFEEAVRVTCCKDYTPGQVEAWVQRATSSRWQELLSGDLHFLAAVSQPSGEVAGFISVRGDGYLHSLFVHPAHQRRGVASFLLRAAEEEARRSEAPDLFSEVSLTAKPFFLSQGFSVEQEQTMRVNGVELTNFRMRKPLIYQPDEADFDELLQVWEEAVRSTHHFLSEEDIEYYKPLVRMIYLPGVDLYCIRNREERIAAFMGLSGERIEMLFVALDAVSIVYISQGEDAFGINARQRRTYGRGTRREQQFVVRFGIGLSGRTNGYFLLLHVDGRYFRTRAYIDVETFSE